MLGYWAGRLGRRNIPGFQGVLWCNACAGTWIRSQGSSGMPRFYFDFDDTSVPDDEGVDLASPDEAVHLASTTLAMVIGREESARYPRSIVIRRGTERLVTVKLQLEVSPF